MRLWLSVDQIPAYPAVPRLVRHDVALVGELGKHGRFQTALGYADPRVVLTPLDATGLVTFGDDALEPVPMPATKTPGGFVLAAPLAHERYVAGEPAARAGWSRTGASEV